MDVVIQDVGGAGLATVLRGALGVWDIQWTADGRYLVYGASSGADKWGAWSVPTLGGEPRYLGCCDASIVGASDTALVIRPASVGDSTGWLRWVTIADGVVRDSLPIHTDGSGAGLAAESFPGGQRLLILHRRNRSGTAVVASRTGVVLDSIVFTSPQLPISVNVAPDGQSLVAWMPRPQIQGEMDVLRYRVSGKGRITTTPGHRRPTVDDQRRWRPEPERHAGVWLRPHGVLGLDAAARQAHEHALLAAPAGELHRACSSGSLSPTGDRILLNRPAASETSGGSSPSCRSTAGPSAPLGPPVELVDWDWAQDGKRVTLVVPRGRDSLGISRMDVPSGRTTQVGVIGERRLRGDGNCRGRRRDPDSNPAELPPIRHSRARGQHLLVFPMPSAAWCPSTPHRTGRPSCRSVGTRLGIRFWSTGSPSWTGAVTRLGGIRRGRLPATEMVRRRVDRHPHPGDRSSTLAWYRIPPSGGKPVRLGTPPRYPAAYRFSGDGLRVMARPQDRRTDIYLVPNFGEALKQ